MISRMSYGKKKIIFTFRTLTTVFVSPHLQAVCCNYFGCVHEDLQQKYINREKAALQLRHIVCVCACARMCVRETVERQKSRNVLKKKKKQIDFSIILFPFFHATTKFKISICFYFGGENKQQWRRIYRVIRFRGPTGRCHSVRFDGIFDFFFFFPYPRARAHVHTHTINTLD